VLKNDGYRTAPVQTAVAGQLASDRAVLPARVIQFAAAIVGIGLAAANGAR
jgi:hypothetical protein